MKKLIKRLSDPFLKIGDYIKGNKKEFCLLVFILLLGGFLRLYKIDEFMLFLGDEGRDLIVVRRFLLEGDLIFVGPGTSVGNMYLGPLYYYLIAPALFLSNFSPVGPSVLVALIGVATVYLVWHVASLWWGKTAGFISSFLYAISPVVIIQSRSSWNPNIMPFFALLVIFGLWKMAVEKKYRWMIITGLCLGIVLQSHYLSLLLFPLAFFYWFYSFLQALKERQKKRQFLNYSYLSIFLFSLLMLPLVIFDAKYNWRNFEAMMAIFSSDKGSVAISFTLFWQKLSHLFLLINTRLLAGKMENFGAVASGMILFLAVWYLTVKREKYSSKKQFAYILLFAWFSISLFGLLFYKEIIYDHYFGLIFPAPFLIVGALLSELPKAYKKIGLVLALLGVFVLSLPNLLNSPLKDRANNQLKRTKEVSAKIIQEARGEPFNFAVVAEKNYEGAYQYYLELWHAPLVQINPEEAGRTITDQLFVVCEYEDRGKCQPTSNPKTEVANFGWSKVDQSWEVGGILLFRLVHNESGKP